MGEITNNELHGLEKGQKIEGFELLDKLGKGGFGEVWKVRELKSGSLKAIKFLNKKYCVNEKVKIKFWKSTERVSRLDHPNIVKIFKPGWWHERPYYIMEYVEGDNLAERVNKTKKKRLKFEESNDITIQLLNALDHAHAYKIFHRDIWPPNILITKEGEVKLADFDLALAKEETEEFKKFSKIGRISYLGNLDDPANITSFGAILGDYTSPEVHLFGRFGNVDHRADIYSLGLVMHFMMTGTRVFGVDLPHKMFPTEIPEYIDHIIGKAIKFYKEDRFSSARKFLNAVQSGKYYLKRVNLDYEFEKKYDALIALLDKKIWEFDVTLKEDIPEIRETHRDIITYVDEKNLYKKNEVAKRMSEIRVKLEYRKHADKKIISAFVERIEKEKLLDKSETDLVNDFEKAAYYEEVCNAWDFD